MNDASATFSPAWLRNVGSALGPLMALAIVIAFFSAADHLTNPEPHFHELRNIRTILVQASPIAVAALGMTVVIIAGGIDLAAGTALALSATVLAWCLRAGYSPTASLLACFGTGLLTGLLNGVLVSLLKVVPFIVTLGTMTVFLGLAKKLADETTVRPALEQVPAWLPALVRPTPDPETWLVAPGVWLLVVLAILMALALRYLVFGRYVFALGSNESTARLCGVPVAAVKIAVYALSGLFVGVAGMYQFARLTSGNPTSGSGLELRVIAAVVIGGGSLSGG